MKVCASCGSIQRVGFVLVPVAKGIPAQRQPSPRPSQGPASGREPCVRLEAVEPPRVRRSAAGSPAIVSIYRAPRHPVSFPHRRAGHPSFAVDLSARPAMRMASTASGRRHLAARRAMRNVSRTSGRQAPRRSPVHHRTRPCRCASIRIQLRITGVVTILRGGSFCGGSQAHSDANVSLEMPRRQLIGRPGSRCKRGRDVAADRSAGAERSLPGRGGAMRFVGVLQGLPLSWPVRS